MTDASTDRISLADRWEFALDPDDGGDAECSPPTVLDDGIGLPGTTDEAEKGERTTERTPGHLTRRYRYEGAAWYRTTVEIPDAWADRRVVLRLERTRPVRVWVDGDPAGRGDSLSTPHEYDLSDALDPGEHAVALRIDTGSDPVAFPGVQRSHAATEHTQTNWNGVVGDLELVATDPVWIDDCRVSPEPAAGTARVAVTVGNRTGGVAEDPSNSPPRAPTGLTPSLPRRRRFGSTASRRPSRSSTTSATRSGGTSSIPTTTN
ncbi:sugar-binding domain-containing protein [Halosimplex aquaticum]